MRTTLAIDDDVLAEAKRYAENRSLSLGQAVSELMRRGLEPEPRTRRIHGLTVYELPAGSPRVTTRRVKNLEAES